MSEKWPYQCPSCGERYADKYCDLCDGERSESARGGEEKRCVFCGDIRPNPFPANWDSTCKSPANVTEPDTVGNRHHAYRVLESESRVVREMMRNGDTEGLAAYANQGNREKAKQAVARYARPVPTPDPLEEAAIVISPSPTADTRSCDFSKVSKDTLLESSRQHISDVRRGLKFFANLLSAAGEMHDHDKLSDIDGFHRDFVTGFAQTEWWDKHRKINRHHLLQEDGVPADVNLVDVLDLIADCVMAGMARSGSVYQITIPPEVLQRAFDNTVELLKSKVKVKALAHREHK